MKADVLLALTLLAFIVGPLLALAWLGGWLGPMPS